MNPKSMCTSLPSLSSRMLPLCRSLMFSRKHATAYLQRSAQVSNLAAAQLGASADWTIMFRYKYLPAVRVDANLYAGIARCKT